jgi:hypothetical protein
MQDSKKNVSAGAHKKVNQIALLLYGITCTEINQHALIALHCILCIHFLSSLAVTDGQYWWCTRK